MSGFDHQSVLVEAVIEHLSPRNNCVYLDGTIGGGGHARAILEAADCTVIGVDRDPAALAAALITLGDRAARLIHGEYAEIARLLGDRKVDGVVLDLGVSSPQLDHAERGFSFTRSGPLDMRMDPTAGETVLELLERIDVDALAGLIFELGEERHARKIARLIKHAVLEDRIHTTVELAAVIAQGIPIGEQRKSKIHPATRTFQALRIAVNRELDQLERFLATFPDVLVPGGRCVVISFHSLEDRLVKNAFRDLAWTSSLPPRLAAAAGERVLPVVEVLTRKPVFASDAEVARNPRSRSARLRACERTAAPNVRRGSA